MVKISFIYLTCGNIKEAEDISYALVEARLAACTNILPKIASIYEWEGSTRQTDEIAVIIKTRAELFFEVEKKIKSLHSYNNPCIVQLDVNAASSDFASWISQQTRPK